MCKSVCISICLSPLVKSEATATFIREVCETSQEFWDHNHEFLSCRQILSEVKVKKLYDQVDRNSSISHVGISSFLIACGRLGIRPSDVDKQMIDSFPKTAWKDMYSEDSSGFDLKSEAGSPEQASTQI